MQSVERLSLVQAGVPTCRQLEFINAAPSQTIYKAKVHCWHCHDENRRALSGTRYVYLLAGTLITIVCTAFLDPDSGCPVGCSLDVVIFHSFHLV